MEPLFENDKFQLFVSGGQHSWEVSGTADHYYDYTDTYFQWRGECVIINKETKESHRFSFSNEARRWDKISNLETLFTLTDRRVEKDFKKSYLSVFEAVLPEKDDEIVTFICTDLLRELKNCSEPIKKVLIKPISYSSLIKAGLAPDCHGQIHMPLESTLPART